MARSAAGQLRSPRPPLGPGGAGTGEVALSYLLFKKDDQGHETSALNVGAFTGGVRVGYQKAETSGAFVAIFFGTVLGVN